MEFKIRKMKKYLNSFSKKCLLLAIIPLLMFSSCSEDVLKETPIDFLAPENAYNTLAGIQQGITGLHFTVRRAWFSDGGDQDAFAIMAGGLGTDIAFHGENPGGNRKLVNYLAEMTPENGQFTFYWVESYKVIQRANVLIERIEASDKTIWSSDAQKNAYLAEAKFFRAWTYRFLVPLYGDIPLITESTKSPKTDYVRTPKADIYKVMEADLTFAAANLPLPDKMESAGRINQKAAWHILSEVYLAQGKFQPAVDAASKVINGYGSALMTNRFGKTIEAFGSGDVFLDLFAYGNPDLPQNTESIWTIQFEPLVTGGLNYPGERAWGPAYFRMGNAPDGKKAFVGELVDGKRTGLLDLYGRGVAWIKPTNYAAYYIWRSDWNNDIRNAKHQIIRTFYYDNPASIYHGKPVDFSQYPASANRDALKDTNQYIYPFFMKHSDPKNYFENPAQSGGGRNHKDVYAIRLAETYLLRAEAYIGLNNKDLAAADINKVRARAKATPVSASAVNIDYLLDERARELYAEEFRHITLRRTGKLLERVRKYCNNPIYPGCNIQDYNVLFPIPQSQIDLNINAEIKNNPGY